ALNEIIREARKNARIRKDLDESERYRKEMYKRILQYDDDKKKKEAAQPSSPLLDSLEESKPIYVAENGKRMRKQQTAVPVSSNLFKACIHGDQTVVTGSTVRMRLLEDVTVAGMKIPANTLFYGVATLGASRLDVVVSSLKVGDNINPVSFVIYDNDAMEGLNLPNNLKASAAKRMEQGLVQNIDMPLSSIGTMASEVTSVVSATTQIAKQILNMSLSQVKVHLKANYQMYIQEETKESKLKRQAVQAELQRLYEEMAQQEPVKSHPLQTLIDKL
ncbi:conjugative transposon protein TraM, partial [Phocaeicola vulgatus]|nr:conjugative transposon protein TraM [Phocaeicola vulgatus]